MIPPIVLSLQCPKCFVSRDDKTQLFVSYGPKTDTELLLNYGFYRMYRALKVTTAVRDQQRRRLAEAFQDRSS
jgi:hypothetical protein